jgi:hypothetical protein
MVPLVLIATMLVVQFALAYHARQIVSAAVNDGATTAAARRSSLQVGISETNRILQYSGGSLFVTSSVSGSTTATDVTMSGSAQVISLIPFVSGITVTATASAPIETFRPQG